MNKEVMAMAQSLAMSYLQGAIRDIKDDQSDTRNYFKIYTDSEPMAIEALEKQSKWIPVSERLPEEGKDVLITILLRNGVKTVEKSKRVDVTMWRGFGRDVNVIAWMPLPEPYKK